MNDLIPGRVHLLFSGGATLDNARSGQIQVLGYTGAKRSAIAPEVPAIADLIARAGHLLGIHKSLRILFPHDRDLAYRWIAAPNRRFDGASPLDIIRRYGYEGMLAVRRYLDFERGR